MEKLDLQMLGNRVIVEPLEPEVMKIGSIIIPDNARERSQLGWVAAAGPGKKNKPMTVKQGDTIVYDQFMGVEWPYNGKTYLLMDENDIVGIIEETI